MRKIKIDKSKFFADYFWSLKDGSEVREDIFAKEYLKNYFTFKDLVNLYEILGKEKLLQYAKELNVQNRVAYLIDLWLKVETKKEDNKKIYNN